MSARRFDLLGAAFGLAATFSVAIGLDHVGFEELGVVIPFAAYFSGLAWWRIKSAPGAAEITGESAVRRVALPEERVAELEAAQQRLDELEERLDFAERLLARQRDAAQLPGQ